MIREMQILVALVGILAVAIVLRDSFETIILPRRVSARRFYSYPVAP